MNTLQIGLIQGNLRCFGTNCNMSRNTRFLCYFFLLKYSSVLYFTLFPSLEIITWPTHTVHLCTLRALQEHSSKTLEVSRPALICANKFLNETLKSDFGMSYWQVWGQNGWFQVMQNLRTTKEADLFNYETLQELRFPRGKLMALQVFLLCNSLE